MNITYPINALPRAIPLCLGVQSEYGARPISIDVSEWVGRWPDIIVSVQPVRPGEDVSYPAAGVTRSGNIVTWTPNAYDTEIPGTGSVEIIGLADGVKIIRTGAATTIAPTQSSVSKTPEDPMAAWADSVIRAGEQAKAGAEEALLLAQAANKSATNANTSAVQAQSAQRAAANAALQAATYRTDAVNAMSAAKNSQTQAKTSEQAANTLANAAYKSQQAAEAAANRAEDAANSMGGGGTVSPGDGKLKADAIICSVSGESVSISDASARDALSVVSHISAPDGVTGIKLTRTGRNIFGGMALVHSIVNQAAGSVLDMDAKTVSYSANNVGGKTLFEYPFKDNTQYTLYFTPAEGSSNSPNMQVFYVGETEGVRLAQITNKTVWVYKTAAGKTVERIAGRSFSGTSILLYEQCGIFEGVLTEADFVPYEAETFTVALSETVTDGTFDWATGVLTINQDGASRTVQLDAKPIAMRDRYNTLWSSTGQTDVRYVADTKAYVDGHGADADSEYADNAGYAENAGYADNAGYAEEAGDSQTVKGRDIAAEVDSLSEENAKNATALANMTVEGFQRVGGYESVKDKAELHEGKFASTGDWDSSANKTKIRFVDGAAFNLYALTVAEGERYKIKTWCGGSLYGCLLVNGAEHIIADYPKPKPSVADNYEIEVTIPSGVVSLYVNETVSQSGKFLIQKENLSVPMFAKIDDHLYEKKLACVGDSITEATNPEGGYFANYAELAAARHNMTVYKDGKGGSTMTNIESNIPPFSAERYLNVPSDYDILTIWFGWNDAAYATVGTIDDTEDTTFYGAYKKVLDYFIATYPTKKIGLIVPYGNASVEPFRVAVRALSEMYGVPCLDLADGKQCSLLWGTANAAQEARRAALTYDSTHPNQAGHEYLSTMYEEFIKRL